MKNYTDHLLEMLEQKHPGAVTVYDRLTGNLSCTLHDLTWDKNERILYGRDALDGKICFLLEDIILEPESVSDPAAHLTSVPFAYSRYGQILVSVPPEKAREAAEKILAKMTEEEMAARSEYLTDSAEIDWDGMLLDGHTGKPIEEDS